jgi:hypothetical protein
MDLTLDELADERDGFVEVLARGAERPGQAVQSLQCKPVKGPLLDLLRGLGGTPIEIARALAGRAAPAELAALAGEPSLVPGQRAIALLAVAIALAGDPGAACPPAALDAVEDEATCAAAIDAGLGAALTGVLRAVPTGELRATRVLVGRRLLAAGETGPHVVELLLAGGDRARAAAAAAAELRVHLGRGEASAVLWAWLALVVAWSRDDAFVGQIVTAIGEPALIDALLRWLERLPTSDPLAVARARAAIGWARPVGNHGGS